MANKNIEGYALHCPTTLKKKYKKLSGMKDFIGFLVFRHYGYENYRNTNNGWFFVSTADFIKENVVGSKTTLHKYETKLRQDGLIEKKTGDFSERKANEYRLLFNPSTGEIMTDLSVQFSEKSVPMENPLETALRNVKGCTDKCTDDITDNEEVNEKSVPMIFPKKCTTDTDTLTETDIKKSILGVSIDTSNKSNVMEGTEEKSEKLKKEILGKSDRYWMEVIRTAHQNRTQVQFEERQEAFKYFFRRWHSFKDSIPSMEWEEVMKYGRMFLNEWLVTLCTSKEKYLSKRKELSMEFLSIASKSLFKAFGDFIDVVKTDYLNSPRKYSKRYEAYSKQLKELYRFTGGVEKEVCDKALLKLQLTYDQTVEPLLIKLQSTLKPEELDPDLKYQNLAEQEGKVEEAIEEPKTENYGDLPF